MQGNWENWRNFLFGGPRTKEKFRENDLKGRQKFSRENVEIYRWSANRDQICQVVRESEKVENRCFKARETRIELQLNLLYIVDYIYTKSTKCCIHLNDEHILKCMGIFL